MDTTKTSSILAIFDSHHRNPGLSRSKPSSKRGPKAPYSAPIQSASAPDPSTVVLVPHHSLSLIIASSNSSMNTCCSAYCSTSKSQKRSLYLHLHASYFSIL